MVVPSFPRSPVSQGWSSLCRRPSPRTPYIPSATTPKSSSVEIGHRSKDRDHGREERRTVKVVSVAAGLLFPYAVQALRSNARSAVSARARNGGAVTVYAITSLPSHQARPADLAAWIRGHWTIDNKIHYVRDVAYGEDHSQTRTTHPGPWPPCAIWPSALYDWPAKPTSPRPSADSAETPPGTSRSLASHDQTGPIDVRLDCRHTQRHLTTRLRGAREFLKQPQRSSRYAAYLESGIARREIPSPQCHTRSGASWYR